MPADTNPDAVKLLSDDEVAEIQARPPYAGYYDATYAPVRITERDALCATVRELRDERLEIQRILASAVLEDPTEDDQPPYSTTELVEGVRWLLRMKEMKQARSTALREQLAQSWAENERLASQLKEWQEEKDTKAGYL